jgi:hypothetical protein
MAIASKPIKLTQVSAGSYTGPTPKPYLVVGTVPSGFTSAVAPAAASVPFADLTAAANAYNALRTALITSGILH